MVSAEIYKSEPRGLIIPLSIHYLPRLQSSSPPEEAHFSVPLLTSIALRRAVLLDWRLVVQLTERELDPRRILRHDTRKARIKRQARIDDRKRAASLSQVQSRSGVGGAHELAAGQEQEGEREEGEDEDDGDVCAQGGDEEERRDDEPCDEVDADVDRERARVVAIGGGNAAIGVDGQGEGEPECCEADQY